MRENFLKSIIFILQWEGYKSDDPEDKGGRTIFGISERIYPVEVKEMWDMPKEDARVRAIDIYLKDYWIPLGCDIIEPPMDIISFDCAVNQGIGTARRFIIESSDPFDYLIKRIARYKDIGDPKYLKGWLNRIIALYQTIKRK